jgi:ribosomal protein S18 acetylase RimI-like enzyme
MRQLLGVTPQFGGWLIRAGASAASSDDEDEPERAHGGIIRRDRPGTTIAAMPLPILQVRQETSPTDLVRLFHRCEAHWVEQLSDPVALEAGTAYANAEFSKVWSANHIRDAALHGEMTPQQAVAEVDAHFAGMGTRCAYWVINPSANDEQTRPLIEYLLAAGYRRQIDDILYLKKTPQRANLSATSLQIIPARASFKHARMLAEESVREKWEGLQQLVEAHLRRLDDSHFDALLALDENRPVATIGVLAVGELGMIEDVYVSKDFRGRGIGRIMMGRALEICARSLFKHVFICAQPENQPAQRLYQSAGFEKIGELVSYRNPASTGKVNA